MRCTAFIGEVDTEEVRRSFLTILFLMLLPAMALGQGHRPNEGSSSLRLVSAAPVEESPPAAPEILPSPPAALDGSEMTLGELELLALTHNPSLTIATAQAGAARGQQLQAGLYPNPMLGYVGMEMGNEGTAGQQGGFVSQRFITGGKRRLDVAVAGAEVRQMQFRIDAQRLRVLTDVRMRFYEALVAQQRVRVTGDLSRIAADLATASRRLLEFRQIGETSLLQSEIESQQAEILLATARLQQQEAWRRMAVVIGRADLACRPLTGDLYATPPEYCWEEILARVLAQSPQVAAARSRSQQARLAVDRAARQKIPDVSVMTGVRHHYISENPVADVQASLAVPLFDANQGNVYKAQAEWSAAQAEVRRIELALEDRLAVAYRQYANARQQAQRYSQQILPRANTSLERVTADYRLGQADYLTLITAQRTYIQAHLIYLDALRDLWQAQVQIEGFLLTDSLAGGS